MSQSQQNQSQPTNWTQHDLIDKKEIARRLHQKPGWVDEQVRSRNPDPLPSFKIGKFRLFAWNSADMNAWLQRHYCAGKKKI